MHGLATPSTNQVFWDFNHFGLIGVRLFRNAGDSVSIVQLIGIEKFDCEIILSSVLL